jgi:signal transduction histidine kinase
MPFGFRDFSIRRKLTLIIVVSSGLMVLVASVLLIGNAAVVIRRNTIYNLTVLTQVLAINSTAALSFRDPDTASELLASLRVDPQVVEAAIFDCRGRRFAFYQQSESRDCKVLPERIGNTDGCTKIPTALATARAESPWYSGLVEIEQPVRMNGKTIGIIMVHGNLGRFNRQFFLFVLVAVFNLLLLLGMAYFLSRRMRGIISKPIEQLAQSMDQVTRDNDYTVRVDEPQHQDELSVLMAGFNHMLTRIQKRDLELERISRQKDEFLRNMSHELRTPLNAIIGFSELLQEPIFGSLNEKQLRYVQDINLSGHHLLDLINEILDLSKIESGTMSLDLGDVDVRQLLEAGNVMIRERVIQQQLQLSIEIADDLPCSLSGDEKRLKQVLFNLLGNAAKFTGRGGRITMRVFRVTREWVENSIPPAFQEDRHVLFEKIAKNYCAISIADTGIGVGPDHIRKIFSAFEQVDSSTSRQYSGTGLGLALCKSFVEMHHGLIWAESEPDKGSTFTFVLPL